MDRYARKASKEKDAFTNASAARLGENGAVLDDNRARSVMQRKLLEVMAAAPVQRRGNDTDLPGGKTNINDSRGLETEADVMGQQTLQFASFATSAPIQRKPVQPMIQLTAKGAAAGAAVGAGIGALGFLAGPVVGGITTAIGAAGGALVGHAMTSSITVLNWRFRRQLQSARSRQMTGGVAAFSQYITIMSADRQLSSAIQNARQLLQLVWTLYQVSGFILNCIETNPAQGEEILTVFLSTIINTLNTTRQPWAAGQHDEYVASPAMLARILQSPVNFLNEDFAGMSDANRRKMLKSKSGWNSEKGPAQLANDLFSQLYLGEPDESDAVNTDGVTMAVGAFDNQYLGGPDGMPVTSGDVARDDIVRDFDGRYWRITGKTADQITVVQTHPPAEKPDSDDEKRALLDG